MYNELKKGIHSILFLVNAENLTKMLPAVYLSIFMVEKGSGYFSFYQANTWAAAGVGTQKVTTEHITVKEQAESWNTWYYYRLY